MVVGALMFDRVFGTHEKHALSVSQILFKRRSDDEKVYVLPYLFYIFPIVSL